MTRFDFLLSANGGLLHCMSSDGELLFSLAVPAGKVPVSDYLALCPDWSLVKLEGLTLVSPRPLGGVVVAEGRHESGANPDFVPTSASRYELEMRAQIMQMKVLNRSVAARIAALDAVQAVPMAVKPVEVDPVVIE